MQISGISASDPVFGGDADRANETLGKDAFMTLLVEQLKNQDPLEPTANEEFIAELANFSSLEEMQELNDNLLSLLDFQGVFARLQGLGEGSALLGKEIEWVGPGAQQLTGKVDSVFIAEDGSVRLRVGDDEVDLRSVTSIREPGQGDGGDDDGNGSDS